MRLISRYKTSYLLLLNSFFLSFHPNPHRNKIDQNTQLSIHHHHPSFHLTHTNTTTSPTNQSPNERMSNNTSTPPQAIRIPNTRRNDWSTKSLTIAVIPVTRTHNVQTAERRAKAWKDDLLKLHWVGNWEEVFGLYREEQKKKKGKDGITAVTSVVGRAWNCKVIGDGVRNGR